MRDFYIEIKSSVPFWGVEDIFLSSVNRKSKLLNVDKLSSESIKIIENSVKFGQIRLIGTNGEAILSIEQDIKTKEFKVDEKDLQEEEIFKTEISCVTVTLEEEEEEEDLEEVLAYEKEASILLEKNGNAIKKIVRSMSSESEENKKLLSAMISVEKRTKNREGIISLMAEVLNG